MTPPAPADRPAALPVRVVLPGHLATLAGTPGEISVPAAIPITIGSVLDALEHAHPALHGAIRDHHAGPRRPYVRYFACGQDFSLDPYETTLPTAVADGTEPLLIVAAIAGG